MRALILVAGAALALTACRGNQQAGETANVDQTLAAGAVASNDITAIDAVTGADANMAADVNYLPEPTTGSGGNSATASPTTTTRPGRPATGSTAPTGNAAAPQTAPATQNSAAPTTPTTNSTL
jgi:hypothetical protein